MLEFLLVVAVMVIAGLSYGCWNMLKKNEQLEEAVAMYENSINIYHATTSAAVAAMRHIDARQIFESDDEVGTVFKQLLECTNQLDAFVTETMDGNITTEETE